MFHALKQHYLQIKLMKLIKSIILLNMECQILIVTYNTDGIGTYKAINVNNAYSKLENIMYIVAHHYREIYHTLKLTYFSETNEFLFTGLLTANSRNNNGIDNNDLVLVEFFNNQFSNYDYALKYERSSCTMNAYSILYLEHKSAYYIMSDIKCNGVNYPLQILTGIEPTEAPTTHYIPPTTQYIPPTTQYIPPTIQYVPPTTQYISPSTQYIPPSTQYIPPSTQNIPPTTQYIPPTTQNIVPTTQFVELFETQKTDKAINPCENLVKCELCDENSAIQNLCISCNNINNLV